MKKGCSKLLSVAVLLSLPTSYLSAGDPFDEMDAAFGDMESSFSSKTSSKTKKQGLSEFEKFKLAELDSFESYKKKLMEEFTAFKKIADTETKAYQNKLGKVWDKPELSSRKVWVEYSKDLTEKKSVDFEKQVISISQVSSDGKQSDKDLRDSVKAVITKNKAEAFKDDTLAQTIEKKSKEKISLLKTAKVKPTPIFIPEAKGEQKLSDKEIDEIVDRMIALSKKKETTNKNGKKVVTVDLPMDVIDQKIAEKEKAKTSPKASNLPRRARSIEDDVTKYAAKAKVDTALVYAVIETESAFNPMARSHIPAYGLMQIVPSSAGQDATQQLFGKAKILSPSYLYASEKNIEIGTTYLNILYYRYLRGVKDEQSRLYCAIAAYNTGAGNVAKAFTGKRRIKPALAKINAMTPDEVYAHLVENLPYEETRNYLKKVQKRMPKYL